MEWVLDDEETRVLGSLIEKELSTPDYYPLSISALTNACNQKSSREPVVEYSEAVVQAALDRLQEKSLVWESKSARVVKFEESLMPIANLTPREGAVLCVLMLRGAQTPGELRSRCKKMHDFSDLEELSDTLRALENWGFVEKLTRQAGSRESRYQQLLCPTSRVTEEAVRLSPRTPGSEPQVNLDHEERIILLEEQVAALEETVRRLESRIEQLL